MKTQRQNGRGILAAMIHPLGGLARIAAVAGAMLFAGEAWGKGINPAYKQWVRQHRTISDEGQSVAESSKKAANTRQAMASGLQSGDETPESANGLPSVAPDENYGLVPSLIDYSHLNFINVRSSRLNAEEALPRKYDAREEGLVTTVKDQNPFGTCWAHAAIGAVEIAVRREYPNSHPAVGQPDFSENNMVMQSGHDFHPYGNADSLTGQPSEYSAGGVFETAFAYLGRWGGPILETQDPYPTAANAYATHGNKVEGISSYHANGYIQYAPKASALDHDEIKRAIMKYGGVWVSYCATEQIYYNDLDGKFYTYDEAIDYLESGNEADFYTVPFISEDRRSFYNCTTRFGHAKLASNHAVLLVGWDDDYSKNNFYYKPNGNGAYLVKNSWGTGNFDEGYLWVSYYDDNMLYDNSFAISTIEKDEEGAGIYQHDPVGLVYQFPDGDYRWGANIFTATNATRLTAVGFYSLSPDTAYTLQVYTGVSAANPVSGTCRTGTGITGTVPSAGFATINLDEPVDLTEGQRFSVVLHLDSPGCDEPFGTEVNLAYKTDWWSIYGKYGLAKRFSYSLTSKATAEPGQSFVSKDGKTGTWRDLATEIPNMCVDNDYFLTIGGRDIYDDIIYDSSTANLCIKAYTKATVKPELSRLEISGTTTSVTAGDTVSLSCAASYNNTPARDVTAEAAWSIVKGMGDDIASVVAPGTIKTSPNVTETSLVRVKAEYVDDGIAKSDTWDFYVAVAPPESPTNISASLGTESSCVRVNWTVPAGATEYAVYRAQANNSGNAQYLDKVTVPKYNDTTATPGIDYWYFVKAKNSSGSSDFSAGASGWRALAAPANVSASDGASVDFVKVTWDVVEGAVCYRVFRAESFDGAATPLTGWISATEFADSTAEPGAVYWYSVIAAVDSTGNRPSAAGIPDDGFRAVPVVPSAIAIEGDGAIPSGGTATYTAFALYSDGSRGESPLSPVWEVSAGTVSRTGEVAVPTVSANTDLVISAQTTLEGVALSGTKTVAVTATAPEAPTGLRLVSATAAGGVSLAWDSVPGASRYVVLRGANGGMTDFTTTETAFTDMSATPGVAYSYRVAAENAAGTGPQSAAVAATIPLSAPTGVKATNDRTDGVRVTWGAVPGATHYRVSRAASASGAKTDLGSSWTAALSFDDTTAVAGTTYTYFVRAATSAAGANASDYSAGAEGLRKPSRTLVSLSITGPDRVPASGEAVYSCAANWSDDTSEKVSPAWSVSPATAGTVGADGKFVASAVSSDTTATITAAYGGKTGTKDVKVVAPAAATATITSVTAAQRWPFSGLVDIDYTLETSPEGTVALVSVSAQDRDHDVPLAATALSGDGADAAVAAGSHRLTWDLAAEHPGFHAKELDVQLAAVPYVIPAPTGLSASQGTSTRYVRLSWNAVEDATGYEVWRAKGSMNSADAAHVTTVTGTTAYDDAAVTPGDIYFYWVKTITRHGTGGFGSAVFGYRARVSVTVTFDGNGGTSSAATLSGLAGDAYGTLPTATRTGYAFAGWFTAATGGTQVTASSLFDENITTLFAHWTPNPYTIHFNPNGGSGTMPNLPMTYGTAKNLTANSFTLDGYFFTGWATGASGVVAYADGASVSNLTTTAGATVTLYAVWVSAAPTNLTATGSTTSIALSWTASTGATSYEVWRNTSNSSGSATKIASPTTTSYEDTSATPGTRYYYWVKAVCANSTSAFSSGVNGVRTLSAPTGLVASQGDFWDQVSVSWTNVSGAAQYEIWRGVSSSQSSAELIGTRYSSPYNDTTAISGTRYYYWVRAISSQTGVESPFSASTTGYRPDISSLVVEGASSLTGGGAAYYEVRARCSPDGEARTLPSSAKQTLVYNMTDTSGSAYFGSRFDISDPWGLGYKQWLMVTNAPSSGSKSIRIDVACTWNNATKTGTKTVTIKPKLAGVDLTYLVNASNEVAILNYTGTATAVNVPSSLNGMTVTAICPYAFRYQRSISSLTLPNTLKIIGSSAFFDCQSLTALDIPASVTSIGSEIITGTKIASVTIPASVSTIEVSAFKYAASLATINVDSSNANYTSYAGALFNKDMTKLLAVPAAKTGSFSIPSGVKNISNNYQSSFCGSKLTSVSIPASVQATPNMWSIAFRYCKSLSSVSVNSGNETLCASGNVLFSKDMKTLHGYPAARSGTAYVVPSSVNTIQYKAFELASKLTSIAIPASVTKISESFSGCTNLVAIYCFGDAPTVPEYDGLYQSYNDWDAGMGGYFGYGKVPATIYYLSGTSGWGEKIGGVPTTIWNNPIQSLSISGDSSVKSGGTSQYQALGTFQSGHSSIACKVTWSITSGSAYASIASDGTLTVGDVSTTQTITLKATANLGGATRTATKSITINP